jgi:Mrp family chromosome partitioning ATPase
VGEPASVSSREFVDKLVQQHADYDIVIIDMPPLETTPVAPALVGASSGILAVIPRGSDEEAVLQLRRSAELFTTPLVGFVYTNAIVH